MTSSRLPALPAWRRPAAVVLVAVLGLVLAGCGGDDVAETPSTQPQGECRYTAGGPASREVDLPDSSPGADAPTRATLVTDQGDVPISLEPEQATCTVNSFLSLAEQGYFDDTPCHRLTGGAGLSVLQCGDPSGTGTGGPGYSFPDELIQDDPRLDCGLDQVDPATGREACTYPAGTVAMANAGADTNGSQFFLVYEDSVLGNAYTVFGRMSAAGLQVVRDVAAAGTGADGVSPRTPVSITDVTTAG